MVMIKDLSIIFIISLMFNLQLTRMLSALASTDDGERILYESVCCSYQVCVDIIMLHANA